MKKILLTLCFIVVLQLTMFSQPSHNKKVVGYYAQWGIYARDYNIPNIDGNKLTHLLYAFFGTQYDAAHPENTKLQSLDEYADFQHTEGGIPWNASPKGNFYDLKMLKEKYPNLKIIISVGGWTKSQNFPAIAASSVARNAFAADMAAFLVTYPFIDGFDIDWEFPLTGGTDGTELIGGNLVPAQPHTPEDNKNLVYLVQAMRNALPGKHISIAAGNAVGNVSTQFIGPNNKAALGMATDLTTYCDFISFFGYDFGGNWYDKTCYDAPLYGSGNTDDPLHGTPAQSLDVLVNKFLNEVGIPKDKLIMGVPFYGKLFNNVANNGFVPGLPGLFVAAPRVTGGCTQPQPPQGTWDGTTCENSGSIEFCDIAGSSGTNAHHFLNPANSLTLMPSAVTAGWLRYWDDTAKVPYLYNATTHQFISYDDKQSVDEKVKYIASKNLAGAMVWELSQDTRSTDPVPAELLSQINTTFSTVPVDITVVFKSPSNTPIAGVSVVLTKVNDNTTTTLVSDTNGTVIFTGEQAYFEYIVTYAKNTFSFLPVSITIPQGELGVNKTYNVSASNQVVTLSGSVKNGSSLVSDVVVKLLDGNNAVLTTINSTDGNYVFSNVLSGGTYKITAEKSYYTFTPIVLTDATANQSNIIVNGTVGSYTISGIIKDGTTALQGVVVTAVADGTSYTATTVANGSYSIANLQAGLTYTVSAAKLNTTLSPASTIYTSFNENKTLDFIVNNYLISGTVKNGSTPVSGAKVQLTLPWTDNTHPYVALLATSDSQGKYFFDNAAISGYNSYSSILTNAWDNSNVSYYPASYAGAAIPTVAQSFNFNSQAVAPVIDITAPTASTITVSTGTVITLTATAGLTSEDSTTTLSSVVFNIAGQNLTGVKSGNTYSATWSPTNVQFFSDYTLTATATTSTNATATATRSFYLNCSGPCPNQLPVITWDAPTQTTINQASGFQPVTISVSAIDNDGTVSSVSIQVNGSTKPMIVGANNTYTYNFIPNSYQDYPIVITATDNVSGSRTLNKTIKIISSNFVPLPDKVVVGYAHSWENSSAPFLYFSDMIGKKYNVIVYSFIETIGSDGYTPQLTTNDNRYLTAGVFDKQLLKNDIQSLRDKGIPVIVSIGGQNGHVSLTTTAQKDTFVAGLEAIIDEYHFDGIDLDFEGGSMSFEAGSLTDFSYTSISTIPKLKNVVDAFKEIKQHYGSGFILTAAPETFYVQVGYGSYSNTPGAFLPVLHNLRNELDLLMVQLYNTGSTTALDNQAYSQATPDFLVSMSDMLIKGFNVAATGFHFDGFPASKIVVGIPACPSAAPAGGYVTPANTIKALDYLRLGTTYPGRTYTLQAGGPYPDLRGVMTWSVNWDAAPNCASAYEFSNAYSAYFSAISPAPIANFIANTTTITEGGSVTFTDTSTNTPTAWAWTFTGGTPATSSLQNPVVTYATAGSYQVSLTATNATGTNTKIAANYITVTAAPVANFSVNTTSVGSGGSVTFTDTSTNLPTSWAWTFAGGTPSTSTIQNPVVTYATVGNYQVSLTATNGTGTNTKTTANYITVNGAPVSNFIANTTSVVAGSSVTFTDTSANTPTAWAWTFAGGTPSTSTAQNPLVTYATAGNYQVSLIATNATGSSIKTTANYIAVTSAPEANFNANTTSVGAGGSVTFTDTSTNTPTVWAWTFAGGTPATSSLQNPVVTYATIGNYQVSLTATNATGTNTKTTANYIAVTAAPVANFSANKTSVGSGGSVTFTDTSTNTPTSWAWTFAGGTPATSSLQNPVVTYATAGNYQVSLISTNSTGSSTKTTANYITVTAAPVANFNANITSVGSGGSVTFTDTSTNAPTSWAWTFTGGIPATSSLKNPVITYATIGNYQVSLTATNATGTNTKTTANYIAVTAAPVANFSANKTSVGSGGSVTFTDTSTNMPTSWAWTFTGGTPATSSLQNPMVTYTTIGNYQVSLIATNSTGTNTKTTANYITVTAAPVANFSANKTSVGSGGSVTFTDTSTNTPTSWAWTFTGGTPATSSLQNPVVTYATAGNYQVSLAAKNATGTNTKTTANYIAVTTAPVANFNANITSVGSGGSVTFTDTSTNTPTSWAWTFTGGTPATSSLQNPVVTYATIGNYQVSLIATNSTGNNTKISANYIAVTAAPVANYIANKTSVGVGGSVTFTDTSTNTPTAWAWTFAGGTPTTSSLQNPVVTYATAGNYRVSLTATNSTGTNTKTTANYISVNTVVIAPIANFKANATTVTAGDSVAFTDTSTNTPTAWAWTFAGGTPARSTAANPVVTYDAPGTFQVTLTVTNSEGVDTKTEMDYIVTTKTLSAIIPNDNYVLSVQGETCRNSKNGIIFITVKKEHSYTAVITANGFNKSVGFNFATPLNVPDLSAGVYTICITIDGLIDYKQCFTVVITEPENLAVLSKVNKSAKTISLKLSGSDSYLIQLNDKEIVTKDNEITLDLDLNSNTILKVSTDKSCQGIYEETIILMDGPIFYPNPVSNTLEVLIPLIAETDKVIPVIIYAITGQQQFSNSYKVTNGKIKIDVSQLAYGTYIVAVNLNGKIVKHKIIKQ